MLVLEDILSRKPRFVDQPVEHGIEALTRFDNGEWTIGPKHDGYNGQAILLGGEWHGVSRKFAPLAFSDILLSELAELNLSEGTILNGEWEKLRRADQPERFSVFDILTSGLKSNGRFAYLIGVPHVERYQMMSDFIGHDKSVLKISPLALEGFRKFYDNAKRDEHNEGVVLKMRSSNLILDPRKSAKNPRWLKVKWRAGDDGLTSVERI